MPRTLTRKVPEIIALFWLAKLLTTAVGESTSDYLVYRINPYAAVMLGFVVFVAALVFQFRTRRYIAWIYWLCVVMVAIFGTMAADVLHIQFGVPYITSTIFFAVTLIVVFTLWHRSQKTLSIHSITNRRRELFYWATVVTTFALGTAAGDLTAYSFNLGFFSSAILFAALIAAVALAYRWFKFNSIAAFWLAYILTRPLGASFADWFGKPKSVGGLGWGDNKVSLILGILIVSLVAYLAASRRDVKGEDTLISPAG